MSTNGDMAAPLYLNASGVSGFVTSGTASYPLTVTSLQRATPVMPVVVVAPAPPTEVERLLADVEAVCALGR